MSNPGTTNLQAWWKLDEASGANRLNSVPNSGVLTLFDFNTVGVSPGRNSFSGNAANFISTNSEHLRCIDNLGYLRPGAYSFSVGVWVYPHNIGTFSTIMAHWDDPDNKEWALQIHANGKARIYVTDGTTDYVIYSNSIYMTNNNWYFVTAQYDAVTNKIRVAANNLWSEIAGPTAINVTSSYFHLANTADLTAGAYFDGLMEDAFYYSRYLTAAEYTWLYNFGHGRRYEDIIELAPPAITIYTKPVIPLINIFDQSLARVGLIEDYNSLNWTERYNEFGFFELELPIEYETSPLIDHGNFLYINTSDKLMFIEDTKVEISDEETSLIVTGSSAEKILERRVLLSPLTWYGSAELLAYLLINNMVINPTDSHRKITIFDNPENNSVWPPAMVLDGIIQISNQWSESDNIYKIIEEVSKTNGLGFKIIVPNLGELDPYDDPLGELYFYMYEGENRSSDQTNNPWVVFSKKLDNIMQTSFLFSSKDEVNVVLVNTPDEVVSLQKIFVWATGNSYDGDTDEPTDLDRFERVLDNTIDRDSDGDEIDDLTTPEVLLMIEQRGQEFVKGYGPVWLFDGDFDARGVYIYDEDFTMGDFVQFVINDIPVKARVVEIVRSYSNEGEKLYMAFNFLVE